MDRIADLLSQIKNAYMANKSRVVTPYSKVRQNILAVMEKAGYLSTVKVEEDKQRRNLVIGLRYDPKGRPIITEIKRISKPGCRIYTTVDKIPVVLNGLGTTILSTPKGIMTGKEAREKNVGGEIICQIY